MFDYRNTIQIDPLEGVTFESSKEDSKTIHIKAKQSDDHIREDCPNNECTGVLTRHGYVKSSYADIPYNEKNVVIEVKIDRYYCPRCYGCYEFKPTSLYRCELQYRRYRLPNIFIEDNESDIPCVNYRMTNRYIKWIEEMYLNEPFNVNSLSKRLGLKPRRLYYILERLKGLNTALQNELREVLVIKARKHNKTIYILIDTKTTGLLDYVRNAKAVTEKIKEIKEQYDNSVYQQLTQLKAIIPIDFKDTDNLINVMGEENISYDIRTVSVIITRHCFESYKKKMNESNQEFYPSLEEQKYLFSTPRPILFEKEKNVLDYLLRNNNLFRHYYNLQKEQSEFVKYENEIEKRIFSKEKIHSKASMPHNIPSKIQLSTLEDLEKISISEIKNDIIDDIEKGYTKNQIILRHNRKKKLLDKYSDKLYK